MAISFLTKKRIKNFQKHGPTCEMIRIEVSTLSEYVAAFSALITPKEIFWFRGHSHLRWKITPSALRFNNLEQRKTALALVNDFKRYGELRLERPPDLDEELKWMQLAQQDR